MCNDIDSGRKGNEENCQQNSLSVLLHTPQSQRTFVIPRTEEKWFATLAHKPDFSWNRVAEERMILFAISWHSVFRATSLSSRGPLKKHRKWKNIEKKLQRGLDDGRAFYFAASCPFITSVPTEPQRIGVKILLSESQLILHVAQEIPVANVDNDSQSGVPSADVSNFTTPPMFNMGAARNSVQQYKETFEPSWTSSTTESLRWRWFYRKCLTWTTRCYNSRHSLGRMLLYELMSRVFTSSKWSQIRTRRSCSRQHQFWSSIGGPGHETLCPLCNWN